LEEGYVAEDERVKLDVYITFAPCGTEGQKGKDCATKLREFAENNNFELNVKAAGPYIGNETELGELMASPYCTVEAFRKKDYIDLAKYLRFPLPRGWDRTPAMIDRDHDTWGKLKKIQNGEYDYIQILFTVDTKVNNLKCVNLP